MKKILGILLTVAMLLSVCPAFAEGMPDIALTGEVNQYGWEKPVETLKITYYSCDDDATNQGEEDERLEKVHQVMLDEFNIDITKLIYSQDSTERLNLMLASNDYPDVIVGLSDEMANTFIDQGRAVELTPYLEKYGQDIIAGYGEYLNLLRQEDGSLYKLSSCYGSTTDVMGSDFEIRWDWYSETGLPLPQNFDDYAEILKAIVANHPTNDNGEKVYGISAFTLQGKEFFRTPLQYLGFFSVSTGIYKLNDDDTITYWVDTDEGRMVAHYINKLWQEGLIDPDFQSKDYDQSKAFMSSSRVAGNIGTWWHNFVGGHQIWETTEENYTINKHMRSLTWEQTDAQPALISNNYIRTARIIITDKCADPAGVVRYWNWQQSPLGIAFNSMGPAGGAWDFDENGDIKVDERYWYGDPGNNSFLWDDFETKECGGWNYPMANPGYVTVAQMDDPAKGWADPIARVNMWDLIPDYSKLDSDRLSIGMQMYQLDAQTAKTYVVDTTAWTTTFSSEDDVSIILQDVDNTLLTDWCNCIMAETDEDCDALYDQMVEDLHALGLDELVAAQQEALSLNFAKMDGSYWD